MRWPWALVFKASCLHYHGAGRGDLQRCQEGSGETWRGSERPAGPQEAWALGLGLERRARWQGQADPPPSRVPARVRCERIPCVAEECAVASLGFPSLPLLCLMHKHGGRADLRTCTEGRWPVRAGWRGRDSPTPPAFAAPARPSSSALARRPPCAPMCPRMPRVCSLGRVTAAP